MLAGLRASPGERASPCRADPLCPACSFPLSSQFLPLIAWLASSVVRFVRFLSLALGTLLGSEAAALLGAPVVSYGKGAVVGIAGEQEHGNAALTSVFGDALREAVGGGTAWITSATKVPWRPARWRGWPVSTPAGG
ncbi:MAG TPA: amino acid synthesis family protein [Streptosporangiaceae bacterium]|nr:amino acid synthesis family protein [Streptosporangiaceae bacterium]